MISYANPIKNNIGPGKRGGNGIFGGSLSL
jgi:hypothetical protein